MQQRRTRGGPPGRTRPALSGGRGAPRRDPGPSRTGSARRAPAAGAAKRTRAPQPSRLTGRATVLVGILIALLLAYAYPVRVYLTQQAEIAELEQKQAAQRQNIHQLTDQLKKWDDPEYVKSQARGRLLFVPPGEVSYLVLDAPGEGGDGTGTNGRQSAPTPWYGKLWSSIQGADKPK